MTKRLDPRLNAVLGYSAFVMAGLAAAAIAVGHPYIAALLSYRTWQSARLLDFPAKGVLIVIPIVVAVSLGLHFARRAADARTLLIVLMAAAMQTNGVKIAGFNLITILPFVVLLFVIGESFLRPSTPFPMTAVTFFALLLLILDLPYLAILSPSGPSRFIINFVSALKAFLVAVAMIHLIEREDHLGTAVKALVVVGIVSALIGVGQIVLNKYAGITFSLVDEEHETKPTFLGTVLRASGLTTWSQHLADYLILVVPFVLFAFMNAPTFRGRLLWLAALAIALGGALLTFTYAAYIAIAVIVALFPFVYWPRRALHFLLAALVFTTVAYATGGLEWGREKFVRHVASSSGMIERTVYLQSTLDELVRDPWWGSGFYAEEEYSENFYRKRVHNTGLQAWANLGLPGFLVFMTMMLVVYTQLWLSAASSPLADWRQRFQALALGMTGMIIAMFAEPNLTAPVTWYFLGIAAAAIQLGSKGARGHVAA